MRRYTPEALWFISGIVLAAGAATWGATRLSGRDHPWITLMILALLAGTAHLYPIRSAREGAVYVLSNVCYFTGAVLLSAPLVAFLPFLAQIPATWKQRHRPGAPIRYAFNSASTVLAMQVAHVLLEPSGPRMPEEPSAVLWMAAAILAFSAVQTVCVSLIIALNSRIPITRVDTLNLRGFLADLLTPLAGALVALIWTFRPWMLFLIVGPVYMIYWMMRDVQLIRSADLDHKTGLYNYAFFSRALTEALGRLRVVRQPVAVLFIDMDLLRNVNNRYGHLAGDRVIRHVTDILQQELPKTATIARFGGEEFVAMLPGTHPDEAEFMGWRLCKAVQRQPLDLGDGATVAVTISVGVAGFPDHGKTADELVHGADLAVYLAKNQGRNRVARAERAPAESREQAAPVQPADNQAPPPLPGLARSPSRAEELARPTAPAPAAAGQPAAVKPPTQRRVIVAVTCIAIISTLSVALVSRRVLDLPLSSMALLVAFNAILGLFRIDVPTGRSGLATVSPAIAGVLVSATLAGAPAAVLAAISSTAAHLLRYGQRDPVKVTFNLAISVLSALAAALVLEAADVAGSASFSVWKLLAPVLASAASYSANVSLLSLAISISSRRPWVEVWRGPLSDMAPQIVAIGTMGAYMALGLIHLGVAGAAMFLLPIVVLFYSFSMQLQRSRAMINALEHAQHELEETHHLQKRTTEELVVTLAGIVDARDQSTAGHSLQVARYAVAIARETNVPDPEVERIRLAALLHDLGKMGVPESIINKPSSLTRDEWTIMHQHAGLGERLLAGVSQLDDVAVMVGEHHEHYDGRGYPSGKKGDEISLGGRILAVCDALDSILSDRPYSRGRPLDWAMSEVQRCAGGHFDPAVVEALCQVWRSEGPPFFENHAVGPNHTLAELQNALSG